MLKWLIRRRLAAFEARYGYDMSYVRALLDTDLGAFRIYLAGAKLSRYRKDVPREAYYAAKLVGLTAEDCGPCTQLTVKMAIDDGVDPRQVRAVLEGTVAAMAPATLRGYQLARAALAHAAEADALRDEVVAAWGPRALAALAFALAAARFYPTVKYALGHGRACTRVEVAGAPVTPAGPAVGPAAVLRALS